MKKRDKKGIGPLITTVLLIGFVVAVATVAWVWHSGVVKEQAQKQSAVSQIQSSCTSEVGINILSADSNGKLRIKNTGSTIIHGVRVRTDKDQLITEQEPFDAAEIKELKLNYREEIPTKIEVMPIIVREGIIGTCSEQAVKYEF
jgi:flagellin-like protein